MPAGITQISWGIFNDALEKVQEMVEKKFDYKTLVVAAIYLAIEFENRRKMMMRDTKTKEEITEKSVQRNELVKHKTLSAGCTELEAVKGEGDEFNYEEFQKINAGWWENSFGVKDKDLAEATQLILSIYDSD